MVLAALCEQFLPSDRGLSRNHENLAAANDGRLWEQHHYYNQWRAKQDNSVYGRNSIVISNQSGDDGNGNELIRTPDQVMPPVAPSTRPRRRRFMASKFLASAAADFDVITDWAFYFHCQGENADHYETEGVYLIPPHLVYLVLATCVIGTSMWLVLATDGKIAAPLLRFFGYDRLNLGHVLLACVVVEDLSQVVLTFWIEDYYEGEGDINSYALVNVVASFYDILIKLAEAYDQRADVVETGHWCKEKIMAHDQKVTCLVVIPEDDGEEEDESDGNGSIIFARDIAEDVGMQSRRRSITISQPSPVTTSTRKTSSERFRNKLDVSSKSWGRQHLQKEIMFSDTKLPPMRFLSASKDGTVKFWDTSNTNDNNSSNSSSSRYKGRQPVETFSGHQRRVSCIAYIRKWGKSSENDCFYFLTGSYDGTAKLWTTSSSEPVNSYTTIPIGKETIEITGIGYVRIQSPGMELGGSTKSLSRPKTAAAYNEHFVTGHKSGKARLWDLWSEPGACLKIFEERQGPADGPRGNLLSRMYHRKRPNIYSLCSMEDSRHFATGSKDGRIQLWDWSTTTGTLNSYNPDDLKSIGEATAATALDPEPTDEGTPAPPPLPVVTSPEQTFVGHKRTVFSIKCVSPGSVFLSGSEDRTAKLWSVSTGACLRTFAGHGGPVHDVAVVDQVTLLTASRDRAVRVWDTFSPGVPFRTYDHDNGYPVTAVSIGDQGGCFVSGTEDGSVGLWIFTSVRGGKRRQSDDSDSDDDDDDDDDDNNNDGSNDDDGGTDGARTFEDGSDASGINKIGDRILCGLRGEGLAYLNERTDTEDGMDYTSMGSGGSSMSGFV